jgi:hypothetical protein
MVALLFVVMEQDLKQYVQYRGFDTAKYKIAVIVSDEKVYHPPITNVDGIQTLVVSLKSPRDQSEMPYIGCGSGSRRWYSGAGPGWVFTSGSTGGSFPESAASRAGGP